MNKIDTQLNVSEIFYSLQGESSFAGLPFVFLRLQGCPLHCSWCDTPYARDYNGQSMQMTIQDIIKKVKSFNCKRVCVTGGEPLSHANTLQLLNTLCNEGFIVTLETNGCEDISEVDPRVIKIIDFKCPDSNMSEFNRFDNVASINKNDEIKFVVASKIDYEWAKSIIQEYGLDEKAGNIIFSPVTSLLKPDEIAAWMLKDCLDAHLQLQLHKLIWGNERGK
jgi:7-carboxy-7-deazaguanine synthase